MLWLNPLHRRRWGAERSSDSSKIPQARSSRIHAAIPWRPQLKGGNWGSPKIFNKTPTLSLMASVCYIKKLGRWVEGFSIFISGPQFFKSSPFLNLQSNALSGKKKFAQNKRLKSEKQVFVSLDPQILEYQFLISFRDVPRMWIMCGCMSMSAHLRKTEWWPWLWVWPCDLFWAMAEGHKWQSCQFRT